MQPNSSTRSVVEIQSVLHSIETILEDRLTIEDFSLAHHADAALLALHLDYANPVSCLVLFDNDIPY